MGIVGLFKFLDKNASSSLKKQHLKDFAGKRVAIDTSVYVYRYYRAHHDENSWTDSFIDMICEFQRCKVIPVFVFDGPNFPVEKEKEQASRIKQTNSMSTTISRVQSLLEKVEQSGKEISDGLRREIKDVFSNKLATVDFTTKNTVVESLEEYLSRLKQQSRPVTKKIIDTVKRVVSSFGLPVISAPGEAEMLCVSLCMHGIVDAAMTEDSDVLAYACPVAITKYKAGQIVTIKFNEVISDIGFSKSQFVDFCILSRCDYNKHSKHKMITPRGKIVPIGTVRAAKLVEEHGTIDQMTNVLVDVGDLNFSRCRQIFFSTHLNDEEIEFYSQQCRVTVLDVIDLDWLPATHRNISRIVEQFKPAKIVFEL